MEERGVLSQRGQANRALTLVGFATVTARLARAALENVLELGTKVLAEDAVEKRVGGGVDVGKGGGENQEHPAVSERHGGEGVEEQQHLQLVRETLKRKEEKEGPGRRRRRKRRRRKKKEDEEGQEEDRSKKTKRRRWGKEEQEEMEKKRREGRKKEKKEKKEEDAGRWTVEGRRRRKSRRRTRRKQQKVKKERRKIKNKNKKSKTKVKNVLNASSLLEAKMLDNGNERVNVNFTEKWEHNQLLSVV